MVLVSQILSTLVLTALPVEATPLAGESVRGELVAVDAEQVRIKTTEGEQSFPLKKLKTLSVDGAEPAAPENPIAVQLTDGSQLAATSLAVAGGKTTAALADAEATGPSSRLRSVLFRSLDNEPAVAADWQQLLQRRFEGDCLAFTRERDDELILEHLEGAVGDIGQETVEFRYQGEELQPKREKVLGLIYLEIKRNMPDAVAVVHLVDGTQLQAAELAWQDGMLAVKTPAGWTASVPGSSLKSLELGESNVVYLSDLKPTQVDCEPYFGVVLESERLGHLPRMDEDHRGQPLKLADQDAAAKGLAIRSQTTMVYRFTRPFKRLIGEAGIAEYALSSDVAAHVVLKISSDQKTLLEEEIAAEDKPLSIDLDLTGVQRLIIEVQYGKSQDIADFLHFCNARLTK